jgi:hypothetical protein
MIRACPLPNGMVGNTLRRYKNRVSHERRYPNVSGLFGPQASLSAFGMVQTEARKFDRSR